MPTHALSGRVLAICCAGFHDASVNAFKQVGTVHTRLTRHPQKSVLRQRLQAPGCVFTGETFDFYSGGDVAQINGHTGSHWSDVVQEF